MYILIFICQSSFVIQLFRFEMFWSISFLFFVIITKKKHFILQYCFKYSIQWKQEWVVYNYFISHLTYKATFNSSIQVYYFVDVIDWIDFTSPPKHIRMSLSHSEKGAFQSSIELLIRSANKLARWLTVLMTVRMRSGFKLTTSDKHSIRQSQSLYIKNYVLLLFSVYT